MAITVKHNKVSTVPDTSDTDLVRPSDWNADHTLTGFGTAAELNAGVANGVATLDGSGKVPTSQIPLQGDLNYQGAWNASTNTPTLASGTGTKGYYYVVSVAGTTNLDGITDWQVGDWAIFNGTVWQKVDNTDAVTSVNGYTGTVVLTYSDVGAANAGANTNITSMSGVTGGITTPDYVTFDTNPSTIPTATGSLYWDSADGNQTLSLVMTGGNAVQQIGEEMYYRVKASSAITEGQLVMFTGTVGASGGLLGAPATGLSAETASYVMGVATESIALNGWGYITAFGLVRGINTTGGAESWVDGQILYYNPSVAGGLTKTLPTAPNAKIQVCAVVHAASNGSLFVRPTFGGKLGQYEGDVEISSPTSGNTLIYDAVQGRWENANISAGTGISVSNGAGSITVTNSAPDQTVSISAGTGISTSGTYPSFTVTNTAPDQTVVMNSGTGISVTGTYPNFTVTNTAPSSGGTVTSVSGTAPIASTGGTTPTISISQATTSTDGYLSSTDWNTFNNKQPAGSYLTTVTASSPLSGSGTGGSPLVISQATTSTSGYLSSTDWNTFNNKQPAGTYVTSVGATSPITSSGGTTPTIAIPQASGSASGYLSSTDWTTFNNKGSGTVTSVSASAGTGISISGSPITSSGTLTITNTGVTSVNGSTGAVTVSGGQFFGTAATKAIAYNANSISENITVTAGNNGLSAGPITVNTGYTVTVETGAAWVIV